MPDQEAFVRSVHRSFAGAKSGSAGTIEERKAPIARFSPSESRSRRSARRSDRNERADHSTAMVSSRNAVTGERRAVRFQRRAMKDGRPTAVAPLSAANTHGQSARGSRTPRACAREGDVPGRRRRCCTVTAPSHVAGPRSVRPSHRKALDDLGLKALALCTRVQWPEDTKKLRVVHEGNSTQWPELRRARHSRDPLPASVSPRTSYASYAERMHFRLCRRVTPPSALR